MNHSAVILDNAIIYPSVRAGNPVLREVNLRIELGELVYLIGRVGSGKSSLLKTLCAELPLRFGGGLVCGYDLRDLSNSDFNALRRSVGVIFQENNLLNDLNIYDNLAFVLRATGWKKRSDISARIEEVLDMVNMVDKAGKMPSQISGGERQRICIARALLNSPELILADEPTGDLDPVNATEVINLFNHISSTSGCAVVIATHNSESVKQQPARVLRCAGGFIEEL